ncbi:MULTISPECIES: hypothetical protein [Streptomyces]|uniref:hypothetical protein n=1 Tax=Streptomyces TaxID=1883 RepID=UPI0029AD3B63|nr:hypothetical protein [Streptomyces sp. AK08-02]MDX3750085.1 hypothetical protein [Streptomyces sp. AK08-02]
MGNRADDEGTDVEIYRKPLTDTVHADTPTGAPEQLLALLDRIGFERKTVSPAGIAGPTYVWHEAPGHLSEDEKKRLATRAVPPLLTAGYVVHIPDYLFDQAAYRSAAEELRTQRAAPAALAATARPRRTRG